MAPPSIEQLAKLINHSVIDPCPTEQDLVDGVKLAQEFNTGKFVTQPFRAKQARTLLEGTGIILQTFVGFPHGSDHTTIKVLQEKAALEDGDQELGMVINLSALLRRYWIRGAKYSSSSRNSKGTYCQLTEKAIWSDCESDNGGILSQ